MTTDSEMLLKVLDTIRDSLFIYGSVESKMSAEEKSIALKTCEDFADFLVEVMDLKVLKSDGNSFIIEGKIQSPEDIF